MNNNRMNNNHSRKVSKNKRTKIKMKMIKWSTNTAKVKVNLKNHMDFKTL